MLLSVNKSPCPSLALRRLLLFNTWSVSALPVTVTAVRTPIPHPMLKLRIGLRVSLSIIDYAVPHLGCVTCITYLIYKSDDVEAGVSSLLGRKTLGPGNARYSLTVRLEDVYLFHRLTRSDSESS